MALPQEQMDYVATTLDRMIQLLGLEAKVDVQEDDGTMVIGIETPDAGRLIGRKGRTLENIEYLLGRIVAHNYESVARIRLDVSGYERGTDEASPAAEPRPQRPAPPPSRERRPSRDDRSRSNRSAAGGDRLEKLARDVAKEVKRWGEAKTIGTLTPDEQDVVRNALRDETEVRIEIGETHGGKAETIVTAVESHDAA